MTKPKSRGKAAVRTSARKASKVTSSRPARTSKSRRLSVSALNKTITTNPRPVTKHARILTMLRSSTGATIAVIMTATDWQQHSGRGFLAGVVRKKLGLDLVSERSDKGRVYRIKEGKTATAAPDRIKHAA